MEDETEPLELDEHTRAAIATLDADKRARLETAVQTAARKQKHELLKAVDDALAFIPGPLRRRVLNRVAR